MTALFPFHLAFPVHDLAAARAFYGGLLGCPEGRSSDSWIDFDLYGHQIVAHLSHEARAAIHNPVDGHDVPVPHFGVVLEWEAFHALAERLRERSVEFVIEPYVRFAGQVGVVPVGGASSGAPEWGAPKSDPTPARTRPRSVRSSRTPRQSCATSRGCCCTR